MLYWFLLYNEVNQLYVQYIPSLMDHIPVPLHLASLVTTCTALSSLCYSRNPLAIYFTHGGVCQASSSNSFHPPSQPHVQISILQVCIATPALKINLSVLFFQSPHLCMNIRYLIFSFGLTLLGMLDSKAKSLHMTQFHSFLWVICHYIYGPHLLYSFIC